MPSLHGLRGLLRTNHGLGGGALGVERDVTRRDGLVSGCHNGSPRTSRILARGFGCSAQLQPLLCVQHKALW